MFYHIIGLPFLEAKAEPLVGVILIVGLILMVLDLDEIRIHSSWVKGEGDEGIDGGGFREEFESPRLESFLINNH